MHSPSKKIISLILVAILVIGGSIYIKYFPSKNQIAGELTYDNSTQPLSVDSSSSTLFLFNPDTAFTGDDFNATDTLTDRFAKTAFSSYVNLDQTGLDATDTQNALVDSFSTEISTIGQPEMYSISDIKTFNPTDKTAIRNYGNAFAQIEITNLTLIANNPKKYSGDVNAIADQYDAIASQLIQIATPNDFVSTDLQTINNYHDLAVDLRELNDYQADPLKAVVAMQNANNIQNSSTSTMTAFSTYFAQNGIIFSAKEAGFIWNQ